MEGALAIANKNSSSGRIAALMSGNQELQPQPSIVSSDTVDKKGNYGTPSSAPSQIIAEGNNTIKSGSVNGQSVIMQQKSFASGPVPMEVENAIASGSSGSTNVQTQQTVTLTKDGKKRIQPQFIRR